MPIVNVIRPTLPTAVYKLNVLRQWRLASGVRSADPERQQRDAGGQPREHNMNGR